MIRTIAAGLSVLALCFVAGCGGGGNDDGTGGANNNSNQQNNTTGDGASGENAPQPGGTDGMDI